MSLYHKRQKCLCALKEQNKGKKSRNSAPAKGKHKGKGKADSADADDANDADGEAMGTTFDRYTDSLTLLQHTINHTPR